MLKQAEETTDLTELFIGHDVCDKGSFESGIDQVMLYVLNNVVHESALGGLLVSGSSWLSTHLETRSFLLMDSWADGTALLLVVGIAAGPCGKVANVSSLQICKGALPVFINSYVERGMYNRIKARGCRP